MCDRTSCGAGSLGFASVSSRFRQLSRTFRGAENQCVRDARHSRVFDARVQRRSRRMPDLRAVTADGHRAATTHRPPRLSGTRSALRSLLFACRARFRLCPSARRGKSLCASRRCNPSATSIAQVRQACPSASPICRCRALRYKRFTKNPAPPQNRHPLSSGACTKPIWGRQPVWWFADSLGDRELADLTSGRGSHRVPSVSVARHVYLSITRARGPPTPSFLPGQSITSVAPRWPFVNAAGRRRWPARSGW